MYLLNKRIKKSIDQNQFVPWSSKGNQVMSMRQVLLKIPGGMKSIEPSLLTTTFVRKVESKRSSALETKTKLNEEYYFNERVYLLYNNMSGIQIRSGEMRIEVMLLYSAGSHRKFMSIHFYFNKNKLE